MIPPRPIIRWPGRTPRSVPIPLARDPFVNAPLLRLTPDQNGLDRFWISSFNAAFGALGVCVNEQGVSRIYPFGTFRHPGFYSAVQTGPDTLWLCGSLAQVVRLDLKTGRFKVYETGAPSALMFAGMAYNEATGKLFFSAYPPPRTMAVSFDIRTCKTVRIYELDTLDHYQRSSYAHADGTHSIELMCPGLTMVRWNPRAESVTLFSVAKEIDTHGGGGLVYRMIAGDDGRLYMPGFGWYDPMTGTVGAGPRPADDTVTWFARNETEAVGLKMGTTLLRRWNLQTNKVTDVGEYPGVGLSFQASSLTRSGRLVCVSKDGFFTRVNVQTGELEMSRRLPTDSVQGVDCVIRIDRERLLGTPFITQRFWEANLRTKAGYDCGAAAPGGGEILRVWKLGGRIYLAAYTGGELMEYNPAEHPHFPENPRVVAQPPTGMRPVASADDGRRIFYACSHHYGHLGSIVTRYDTRTGVAFYRDNPLPNQQIISLCYAKATNSLLCGTTYEADCASLPPTTNEAVLARLDAETGDAVQTCKGPAGSAGVRLIGPLGRNKWLGTCWGEFPDGAGSRWFEFDAAAFQRPEPAALQKLEGWGASIWECHTVQYAGKPGFFVFKVGPRVELWDMRKLRRIKVLGDTVEICNFFVQDRDVLMWTAWDVFVLEKVLP